MVGRNIPLVVVACIGIVVGGIWILKTRVAQPRPPVKCLDCNVILIAIDPLRADAVLLRRDGKMMTPAIGRLAETGFVFSQAYAVAPWTLPSAMSLMTGVYPSMHGIVNKELIWANQEKPRVPARLSDTAPDMSTLAENFKTMGYVTGGFAGGAALSATYGFDKGFDTYVSGDAFDGLPTSVPLATDFIRAHAKEKMFVFIHGFDVHGQYIPKDGYSQGGIQGYSGKLTGSTEEQKKLREEGVISGRIFLTPEDVRFLRGLYDEKAVRLDEMVKKLLDELEALNLTDKTIIIFTSNHGEEFYEHGRIDHGMTLFDEVLHVPLFVVVPGYTSRTITAQVRNIDIVPTLFSILGKKMEDTFARQVQGESLLPLMLGKSLRLDVFAETSYRYATFQKAIRTWDGWKLIFDQETRQTQVFHIEKDPEELENITGKEAQKESELMGKLSDYIHMLQRPK